MRSSYFRLLLSFHTLPYRTLPYRSAPYAELYRTLPYVTAPQRTVLYRTAPPRTVCITSHIPAGDDPRAHRLSGPRGALEQDRAWPVALEPGPRLPRDDVVHLLQMTTRTIRSGDRQTGKEKRGREEMQKGGAGRRSYRGEESGQQQM